MNETDKSLYEQLGIPQSIFKTLSEGNQARLLAENLNLLGAQAADRVRKGEGSSLEPTIHYVNAISSAIMNGELTSIVIEGYVDLMRLFKPIRRV